MSTKLRALYQRKKGRDLFDLYMALEYFPELDLEKLIFSFNKYMAHTGKTVSRAEFEKNLEAKINSPLFTNDISPLITHEARKTYDVNTAAKVVASTFLSKLSGIPWKSSQLFA